MHPDCRRRISISIGGAAERKLRLTTNSVCLPPTTATPKSNIAARQTSAIRQAKLLASCQQSPMLKGANMRHAKWAVVMSLLYLTSLAYSANADAQIIISSEIRPGVYGRVDIGNAPPPPVVYVRPMTVVRAPRAASRAPYIYTFRRGTQKTGASIAASTTPVASPSTS